MQPDDMTLLRQWREGDLQAGDALIRRHYTYAYRIAKRRLGHDDDAAEATQHALTVVVQKRDAIDTDFRRYLTKVVYFSVLSQTKRREHEPLQGDERDTGSPRGASTMMAQREEEKLLVKALRSLSIDDQLLFYFDFVGNNSRTEIAELLGLSPKGVYKRVHAAKQCLRKQLESFRDSPVRQSTLGGLDTWLKSLHEKAPADSSSSTAG
jgi:RNA polymerase sigma factor (sigma-70 family)